MQEETVIRYEEIYLKNGIEGLCKLNYSGKPCELNASQLSQVKEYVKETHPQSSLPIADFIERSFGISYTSSGLVAIFHRLGFSYKKPKQVPGKSDPDKQKQWFILQMRTSVHEGHIVLEINKFNLLHSFE